MPVIQLPAALQPQRQSWGEVRSYEETSGPFGSQWLETDLPMWSTVLEYADRNQLSAGEFRALVAKLRNGVSQLEVYDYMRPAPLGTYRGTLTLAADVAQGATSMQLVRATDNLLTKPEDFDSGVWSKTTGLTVGADVTVAPDGRMVADRLTKDAAGFRYAVAPFTATAGNLYSAAAFGKADTLSKMTLLLTGDNAVTIHGRVVFDFSAKTASNVASTNLSSSGIVDLGGWFYCWLTALLPVASAPRCYVYPDLNSSAVAGSIFAWGAKVNAGAATPYGFGLTLLCGDWLGIGSGVTKQLIVTTEDATSFSQGIINVKFQHPLRNAFPAGTSVVWDKPTALFRLANERKGWKSKGPRVTDQRLELTESFVP